MTHRASARAARAPNYIQYVFFDLDAGSFGID